MSDFTLGEHAAQITQLLKGQEQLQRDVAEIKNILAERRGERRLALWVAGAAGALAAGTLKVAAVVLQAVRA